MIDSYFAGRSAGSAGVGGPEVGPKTAVIVSVIAAGLGILYLAFRKPDPRRHPLPDAEPSPVAR